MGYLENNAPEPWERHRNSRVETRWPNCGELSAGEDLTEAHSGLGFYESKSEWAWPVMQVGCPRRVVGVFVIRYDALSGKLFTSVEKPV